LKQYDKLGIKDTAQIEMYKTHLIELHHMGYKRIGFNLKILVQFGNDNDFSEAIKQIQSLEDNRLMKNKERREERDRYKRDKKEIGTKRNRRNKRFQDDGKEEEDTRNNNMFIKEENNEDTRNDNVLIEEEKNEDYSVDKIMDWPVGAYSTLYVDGNNMLFLNSTLRHNTLRRKKKKSEKIITNAVEQFCNNNQFDLVIVIFDQTNLVYEKVLSNGTKLVVTSARPQFKTSDDAIVDFNEKQSPEVRIKSLIATSDRGLCDRLTNLGAHVMKSKMFLSAICKAVNGTSMGLSEWFSNIDATLM